MIDLLGWVGTVLVLIGYWANSNLRHHLAMTTWIVGDVIWITYDVFIENWSHYGSQFSYYWNKHLRNI
jgi:hypothetical protein